jgi:peptidylprolyl isomerase
MVVLVFVLITAVACGSSEPQTIELGESILPDSSAGITTESGLQYIETEAGTGAQAQVGDKVAVHYTGTLADGTQFDSSLDRGKPFEFVLGRGAVIAGWDEGIALMKEGGKATLVIPPALGYGGGGITGVIPGDATLVFEVELVSVQAP